MKTKATVSLKKQPIVVRDLDSKKNPKGGALCMAIKPGTLKIQPSDDCNSALQGVSTTR
jgi:hypothetical protein